MVCPRIFFSCFLFLVSCFGLISCLSQRQPSPPPAVLAEVNGAPVKEDTFRLRLNLEQFQAGEEEGGEAKDPFASLDVKKGILKQMVQNRAIIDWGKKEGISLTNEEQAQGLAKLKKGYTEREFEEMLERKNSTYAQWSEMAEENLTVQKIIRESLYHKIKVTPAEVAAYFQKHKDEFAVEERVHVRQIVTDTAEKAQELHRRVVHGENFAKVAIMHSISPDRQNGGDLSYFARGTYPKEFDEACFSLEPGEISGVVKSPYGYHIFKMLDKKPKGILSIEEALPRIESELFQKKLVESYQPWLDNILAHSIIRIDERALERFK